MNRFILLFILQMFLNGITQGQVSIDELIRVSTLPSKNIYNYMNRKGFILSDSKFDSVTTSAKFIQKKCYNNQPKKSIDIYILKDDSKYFTLHTSAAKEYFEGEQSLVKSGFFYDTLKNLNTDHQILFQKANITVNATSITSDGITEYSFCLRQKAIPSILKYAEDLLQFDSNVFLESFFGKQNVKKDMYYLSEKELKKCSVLFSGTQRQVIYVWGDDVYLNNLSYIIVTNKLPTQGAKDSDPLSGNNEWELKNGIHLGMALKDLIKINEMDFDIYGNKSEMAFIVKPNENGKIDFKKTAVMLSCHECFDNKIFNQQEVSALAIAKANLPMRVFDMVIYASKL